MIRFLLGLSLVSILSCTGRSGDCPTVFFGGEIVNPTSDYVVLYRNDSYIDSVKLDDNNRFAFKLGGIEEGLYHFDHSPEQQYLYLQEGDSILIRLNTMEFDESLVFSGRGSDINNFLIEMFLANERDEHLIYSYYKLPPTDFARKLDSIKNIKVNMLKDLTADNTLSDKVLEMAEASIYYTDFLHKETYPFYHKKKTGNEVFEQLSDSFYDYRATLDLNNRELAYFRPYFDFLKYHFGNLSYMTCQIGCGTNEKPEMGRLHFNKHKLKLVDSLVQEQELRDILFRNIAMDYLLKEHNASQECQIFIDKFRKLSSNEDHKAEINHLYEGIQNLQPQKELPNLQIVNTDNQRVSLKDISKNKKTVFYFWTASQKGHFKNITKRIAKLQEKYPNHHFVGINVKTSYTQWMNMLEEYNLDKSKQFHGDDFREVQTALILDDLYKCVIAEDTVVVDAFTNLYAAF
ncbi:MAG: transaldolase [Bacteroidota bacterium]